MPSEFNTILSTIVFLHHYADEWAAEDKELDQRLAEIRERNGGKRPNIGYLLIDDTGFGEFGIPALNKIRGSRTPNINQFAELVPVGTVA